MDGNIRPINLKSPGDMLREHTVVTVLEVVWVICKERFPRISIPFFDGSHMICIVNLS